VVAGISLFFYARAKQCDFKIAWPYLILSVPLAYLGAKLPLSKELFALILATLLLVAAIRFLFFPVQIKSKDGRERNEEQTVMKSPTKIVAASIGGILGLFSGIVGIGGGVFLSPILIFKNWASTKQTAAISALFIVVNSLSGLAGRISEGPLQVFQLWPFLMAAIPAALIGSIYGAGKFGSATLQRLLAAVLILASAKLFISVFTAH